MLKLMGTAGAALVAGGMLGPSFVSAAGSDSGGGNGNGMPGQLSQLSEQCEQLAALIGDPNLFRPQDLDVISKLKNESIDRAVNLRWFGAVGDGVTDDKPAWDAAVAAVPAGGSLYVPPGEYYSVVGFACPRGDITIFGAGPGSRLIGGSQQNTLLIGSADRLTRYRNVNVHSLRFTQQPGPSGSGSANNYAGVKVWYADRVVVHNNDFENCDVGVSLAGGDHTLGFPGRVTARNMVTMNRMLNTRKMGIEIFFQDHAFVYGNQMINEDAFPAAESHAIRNIGSNDSYIVANEAYRFRTGISNQGGQSNGYRESRRYVNALNRFRKVVKGIMGTVGVFDGQVLFNTIEEIRDLGIEFRWETLSGQYVGWNQVHVIGNTLTADPAAASNQIGASFHGGSLLIYRGNQSIGFGNQMTKNDAYHVFLHDITKVAIVEGNYFEDAYYLNDENRNRGVRARENGKTVISRNNVFVSPHPDAALQNGQVPDSDEPVSTGQFVKGFVGVPDMNDYLQG